MNVSDPKTPLQGGATAKTTGAGLPGNHQDDRDPSRDNFSQDFRRFFLRGLAALMPTLITFWLLLKAG